MDRLYPGPWWTLAFRSRNSPAVLAACLGTGRVELETATVADTAEGGFAAEGSQLACTAPVPGPGEECLSGKLEYLESHWVARSAAEKFPRRPAPGEPVAA